MRLVIDRGNAPEPGLLGPDYSPDHGPIVERENDSQEMKQIIPSETLRCPCVNTHIQARPSCRSSDCASLPSYMWASARTILIAWRIVLLSTRAVSREQY